MKEVFRITIAGVYCANRSGATCSGPVAPASGGPAGWRGHSSSEITVEDGTIPFKVVFRCLADPTGLLWRIAESQNRTLRCMPDALYITHIHCVGQRPRTARWGAAQAALVDITENARSMAPGTDFRTPGGGRTLTFRPWAHSDQGMFFADNCGEHC